MYDQISDVLDIHYILVKRLLDFHQYAWINRKEIAIDF